MRYWRGAWPGVRYRLQGRHPDFDVADDLLADRVRSTLGPLEHRLDIPRVHVMVQGGVVLLHGDVPDRRCADMIEAAVLRVPGVRGAASYLHIGLLASDTRPSEGAQPSAAYRTFLEAARTAGATEGHERLAARVVLGTFLERVPENERDQVLGHLPRDARSLAEPVRHHGMSDLRRPAEIADALVRTGAADAVVTGYVVGAVLGALRALVPEEAADIAAVLPGPLRAEWESVT
ncbi:MAG TPA: DUF2267 domain-containing protein [Acidimicrobiia bacterium]